MLDQLTKASFETHLNDPFQVETGADQALVLTLAEVVGLPERAPKGKEGRRQSFSLLFRGPKGCYLPQKIYNLEHEKLGALSIFLVPLQPDAEGSRFEAVFN
jgi:hypothetical protein